MAGPEVSDSALTDAQHAFHTGSIGVWELVTIENDHLRAQEPVEASAVPRRSTVVIDRVGDAWRLGITRWTRTTQVDGVQTMSVARLTHGDLVTQFGPIRKIGNGGGWQYETIRGRA